MNVSKQLQSLLVLALSLSIFSNDTAASRITALRPINLPEYIRNGTRANPGPALPLKQTTPLRFSQPVTLPDLPTFGISRGNDPSGWIPCPLAAHDFDKDGKMDLIVGFADELRRIGSYIQIYLGRGDGTFRMGTKYDESVYNLSLAMGDLNEDGKMDFVTGTIAATEQVNIFLGNGDGTFKVNHLRGNPGETNPVEINSVGLGDFNNDGRLDIAIGCGNWGGMRQPDYPVAVWLNNGDSFRRVGTPWGEISYGHDGVTAGDFNQDGYLTC